MPAKLERCVKKVAKTKGKDAAWGICRASVEGKGSSQTAKRVRAKRGKR